MGRPIIDLANWRFGRWTALAVGTRRSNDGSPYWLCECECGTQREVERVALKYGRSLSCGCLISESNKARTGELHPRWKGNDADYFSKHHWVNRHFEKTGTCSECGNYAGSVGQAGTHWHNESQTYNRNVREDWIELCPPCHGLTRGVC